MPSRVADGRCRGGDPAPRLPLGAQRGDSLPGRRAAAHPGKARAPLLGARALGPRPGELPKTLMTPPRGPSPQGRVTLPTPVSRPRGFSHSGRAGDECRAPAPEPGSPGRHPQRVGACAQRPMEPPAGNASCENGACGPPPGAPRPPPQPRPFASPRAGGPQTAEGAARGSLSPPGSQARVGEEQGPDDFSRRRSWAGSWAGSWEGRGRTGRQEAAADFTDGSWSAGRSGLWNFLNI